MESRKITIISTKNNKKIVITTNATTLGELKRDLSLAGVDYDGMTFYEGLTKTELMIDDSILPQNVQRTNSTTHEPEVTNELVFMLTVPNKKIKSGSLSMTRTEAYDIIKKKGIQSEFQSRFGRPFTQCKTSDLISVIENFTIASPTTEVKSEEPSFVDSEARKAILRLVDYLFYNDVIIDSESRDAIISSITSECSTDESSPYSDDELDELFKDMRI